MAGLPSRFRYYKCEPPVVAAAACITAGIGSIAAARGVTLTSLKSRVEGEIDLRGILGLSDTVRNGYKWIRISFDIAGDATP